MTSILHGTWLPTEHHFFFWAEHDAVTPSRGRTARMRATAVRPHPFAASAGEVATRLGLDADAAEAKVPVWLPTAGSQPLPSPELVGIGVAAPASNGQAALAQWQVPGVALPPNDALDALLRVEAGPFTGADLRAWRLAALLALEALAGQQVLPALRRVDSDGRTRLEAYWQPRPAAATRQKLAALAGAMPALCRAAAPDKDEAPTAQALLNDFVAALVDAAARQAHYKVVAAPDTPAGRWLAALCGDDPRVRLRPGPAQALYDAWQQWASAGEPGAAGEAFRLTFRLEPPEDGDEWALTYHLQANDDPSLLVPLRQLWRQGGQTFTYLNRRFDQPQERVLTALAYAGRVFQPVEVSLQQTAPEAAYLNTQETFAFLREAAPLLEQAGFGVLMPAGWQGQSARLQVRARASTPGKDSQGLLNFDTLVKFNWEVTLDGVKLSRAEFERLAALKQPLVQVRGQWVLFDPQQAEAALKLLRRKPAEAALPELVRLSLGETPDALPPGLAFGGVAAEGALAEVLAQLAGPEAQLENLPAPRGLHGQLRPYQARGLAWLAFLRRFGLGACLADDMGLGKTIQTIALLLHERERLGVKAPALLVCPTSVVGNWQRELERFAPGLRVLAHRGADRKRGAAFARALKRHDVVVTSYSLLTRDRALLAETHWSTVVLDEAQNVKNPHTKQAQAARALRADNRVALTGTPVENRLSELWSIMHFLNPGLLGSEQRFRRELARPIERTGDAEAAARLRRLTGPFILRRVKTDPTVIADLPDKLEMKVFCPLTQEQATLYQAVVADALAQVAAADAEGDSLARRGLVLAMLLKLKQVCNHPAQFLKDGSPLPGRSGKLARLTEMLEEACAAGDRALVFTQFAEMGQLLQSHLREALWEEVLFLHGGTPAKARDEMVRRFQARHGPKVFVLSLKAGGTGLNLTAANHVFHFDRWWNPAVENQATDRAFRIGQRRNVQVHKFVCQGTLEDRIDEMIEAKQALAATVLSAGENWLTELSTAQLRDLVALQKEYVVEGQG